MAGTRKYSVIAIIGVVIAIGAIVFSIVTISGGGFGFPHRGKNAQTEEAGLDISDFNVLVVEGLWDVEINMAASGAGRIELNAPASVIEDIRNQSGNQLRLRSVDGFRAFKGKASAVLYVSSLEEIRIAGASEVELKDMVLENLLLRVEGAGNIEGNESRIQNLDIIAEGAAAVDFMDGRVVNADIRVEGAASIEIMMDGGNISGSIEGIGSVEYAGTYSQRDFTIDGLGSFEYLD